MSGHLRGANKHTNDLLDTIERLEQENEKLHAKLAARCNDTAPVAPIGDEYIEVIEGAINSLIFVNANYSSIPGGMSRAQIIRDLRELLAAVAAQGKS